MENGYRMRIALAVASVAAISIYFTRCYRRWRIQKSPSSSCYLHAEPKPQYAFKRVLADNSYNPFKHLKLDDSDTVSTSNLHPFEAEITSLLKSPPPEIDLISGIVDLKMNDSYVWVETELQLKELVEVLRNERFFAVDTEQHSLRSYLGFTALIQISTQKEDYLLDTIALHDVMGILRPVFANPSICKVFHGADNDVLWLQRDFHIYVVNLFDTAKACEVLSKPQKSLAYLLETYCGVATNKLLQREDWRQRPLSEEMVHYARADAHYLLYIANCSITELKQQDSENSCADEKIHFVLEATRRSNMICLQLYTKDIEASPGESAALSLFLRYASDKGVSSVPSENKFQDLVRRLCAWRDLMARVHDESLRYVLSDQAIVALANKAPTNPTDIYEAVAQASSNAELSLTTFIQSPSAVVSSHLYDIYHLLGDKIGHSVDVFTVILQKCLGPNGSCPLSIFNYAVLGYCYVNLTSVNKLSVKKYSKHVPRKASRDRFVQKFSCKSPVYHNCRIYANDGRLLCYCDRRKLEWYLNRDLAKIVDENPPAIMLLFEPKGRPEDEDNGFYIQSKKNICVGCGERNHYLRYRIIPSCYRIHFPEHLKSHRSHDIVLLCVDCHEVAHAAAEKYKRKIAVEFGIPLFVRKVIDLGQESITNFETAGVSPLQLRSAAMALLRHGPRMPPNRHEELIEIVKTFYGGREISEEDLQRALLVGMSPHERRKFQKKRGLPFKHSTGSISLDAEQEKQAGPMSILGDTVDAPNISVLDDSDTTELISTADDDLLTKKHTEDSSSLNSEQRINGAVSLALHENVTTVSNEKSACSVNDDNDCQSRYQQNGMDDLSNLGADGTNHAKHNSKLSFLGHGQHGKQVVDYLLKEHGEDGIQDFCQRWRQVFIEAVNPRFLPAGWDVKHSGRRDFGEFSVYNPAKKGHS
ncbi:protein RRP6-like 3 isoform X1 [Quillaja saponaria]|uniref:Protein RRP6-like 3 isoform X1 n=1 Tax=Quillaja saponaria TaxID=32244 RepID=A0AAD7VMY0_QUISA|nr:protein RRP6-like 3 isoform X1 [Quillaja saponaria]